ncbi:MAG TPA: cell division protein FtsA, partial [Bryobacteraceae bacterium]|nr:cell division protein FtsA [Bryobacteraceae bacterium]
MRCLILLVESGHVRYAGHSEIPSDGWSKGRLADQQAVTTGIRAAVREAERQAQVSVDALVVGLGGAGIDGCNSRGIYEFGRPRPITIDDMEYAVARSEHVRLEEDRLILHLFPQDFTLDGRAGKRYPRGSICSRLEANVHIVTCSEQEHQAILYAVHQASYAVEESIFEPVATAYSSVSRDHRVR